MAVRSAWAASPTNSWATESDAAALGTELRAFFHGAEVRHPGSAGNLAIEDKVAGAFTSSGLRHGEIRFRAPCFEPGRGELALEGAPPIPLLAMHPAVLRPGNFAEKDIAAEIVYLGGGKPEDLSRVQGVDLTDKVVLLDFDAPWAPLLRFGVKGFLFAGSERCTTAEALGKVFMTEVRVPRFYVSEADATAVKSAIVRSGGTAQGRIRAEPSRWKNRVLRDLWAFIPGADPDQRRDVVVLAAPLDASCVVPDLAQGGQSAANLFLLVRLFDAFRRAPPARSVLLVAVNAHTQYFRGERLLAWNLLAPGDRLEEVRNTLARDLHVEELIAGHYEKLSLDPAHRVEDERLVARMRTLTDDATGRNVSIKEPIVNLVKRDVNRLRGEQLALVAAGEETIEAEMRQAEERFEAELARAGILSPDETGKRREAFRTEAFSTREKRRRELEEKRIALEAQRVRYADLLALFNRAGVCVTLGELYDRTPESVDLLRGYVREIVERNRAWAALDRADLEMSAANGAIRDALGGGEVSFVLCLDLSWSSDAVGLATDDFWGQGSWQTEFGRTALSVADELPAVLDGGKRNLLADTMTKAGGRCEGYHFPVASGGLNPFHAGRATPAFALRTVQSNYEGVFTPGDTLDSLDPAAVSEVMAFVPAWLRGVLDRRDVTDPSKLPPFGRQTSRPNKLWSIQIKTFRFDEFSAAVLPTLPVPGSSVILRAGPESMNAAGVILGHFALTDERASTVLYGLHEPSAYRPLFSAAFHYDEDFVAVDHTIDAGEIHARVGSNITLADSRVLAMFPCREFPLLVRDDSSLLSAFPLAAQQYYVLGAEQNAAPRRYGFTGISAFLSSKEAPDPTYGPAAVYFDVRDRIKVLTRDKRGLLNASEREPVGVGYASAEQAGADFFAAAARDILCLCRHRIAGLRGVSDELARDCLRRGEEALREMAASRTEARHLDYLRSLYRAIGALTKAYEQTAAVTNDMLKAVVFYLALLLPFCFFVQRLLFRATRIEVQMGQFAVTFVLTFVVFRFIHPAFRVARAPEVMFVAFVMGSLGLFVIRILHGRFEGEMQLLFQTYAGLDASEVTYSTAGQQALMIGVNNMKRRRIRTALTTATIVLVTFTMLAFTSVSKKLSPTIIAKSKAAPYTGIMFHWPGRTMDEDTARVLCNLFAGRADVVVRRWFFSPRGGGGIQRRREPMRASLEGDSRGADLDAILGLPRRDDGFVERIPLLPGSRYFSADDADEIIVSGAVADALGLAPGRLEGATLRLRDARLRVVGILDDERFRALRDLDGKPLVPIDVENVVTTADEGRLLSEAEEAWDEAGATYVNISCLALMPGERLRLLGGQPYSVSARFADDEPIWPVVEELLTATRAKFFVGSRAPFGAGGDGGRTVAPGVYFVGSGYRTSIGGLSALFIPLMIAGTIILNTMLGSVYERRSEIAVYNAVGLNPTHVGVFFLAEAFVYGVIGAVGGYLIGQILSLVLSEFDLVRGVNLNFSSLSVVYVILFTVAVVMLSTLYPARVATRAAVPSGKKRWSLPANDGSTMRVPFPFIYREDLVPGIMAYLDEYFVRNTEASLGDMIARPEERAAGKDAAGRAAYALRYHVALAPFDLGVTQTVSLRGGFDEPVGSYRVFMDVQRLSGQDTNWEMTNRPFLERLRQHMLRWRNLTAAEHALFVERAAKSFGTGA